MEKNHYVYVSHTGTIRVSIATYPNLNTFLSECGRLVNSSYEVKACRAGAEGLIREACKELRGVVARRILAELT